MKVSAHNFFHVELSLVSGAAAAVLSPYVAIGIRPLTALVIGVIAGGGVLPAASQLACSIRGTIKKPDSLDEIICIVVFFTMPLALSPILVLPAPQIAQVSTGSFICGMVLYSFLYLEGYNRQVQKQIKYYQRT